MKIVTDQAADLPAEEASDPNIIIAPLYIQFPDGELASDQISPDEFYERLSSMAPNVPTTAQPSAGVFQKIYQKLAETGEEILSIHISSGLSGTIDSARLGASQVVGAVIHLVDSFTLSGGQRFQVLAAIRGKNAGWYVKNILERLEKVRNNTEVIYTLDTLDYLQRGGRIGRVQALASMLLHIKPVIHVDHSDGKYSTVGKTRTIHKALELMTENLKQKYQDQQLWVSVMHGKFSEQAEILSGLLRNQLNIARLEVLRISPVLGVHTGPGIVGVAAVPNELLEF
jgi:DegV family protein with EDD domain